MDKFPRVNINLSVLEENARVLSELCGRHGIKTAGVIKGCAGIPECAEAMMEGGCRQIASSRIEHLAELKKRDPSVPTLLIRIPMLSELAEVVQYADYTLVSEEAALLELDREGARQNRIVKAVLMYDLGDLREGILDRQNLIAAALRTEFELKHVELAGIGTNLSCYGSIVPDSRNMSELADAAAEIEARIGRKLEIVSGGATTVIPLMVNEGLPERINHLRLGESILSTLDLPALWDCHIPGLSPEAFTLTAEIIELNDKPTHPIGTLGVAAFGKKKSFIDRGIRKRAILAVGNMDLGDASRLLPKDEGVTVLGSSGDHTIVDIEDCERVLQVGDCMEFNMVYQGIVYSTFSPTVEKVFMK